MILCYNASLHGGRLTWEASLVVARAAGFDAIDIPLRDAARCAISSAGGKDRGDPNSASRQATATKSLLAGLRLAPGVGDLPVEFRKDETTFAAGLNTLDSFARLAAGIGCPRMSTWVPCWAEDSYTETYSRWQRRFRNVAAILAAHGVRLGLEFISPMHLRQLGREPFIWRMDDMLEFAASIGPNVGLLLDSFHWHLSGATGDNIRRAGRERIIHVHLNDAPKKQPDIVRDDERLLPGEGAIALDEFFAALRDICYRDAVSVEILGNRLSALSPSQAARAAHDAARPYTSVR